MRQEEGIRNSLLLEGTCTTYEFEEPVRSHLLPDPLMSAPLSILSEYIDTCTSKISLLCIFLFLAFQI